MLRLAYPFFNSWNLCLSAFLSYRRCTHVCCQFSHRLPPWTTDIRLWLRQDHGRPSALQIRNSASDRWDDARLWGHFSLACDEERGRSSEGVSFVWVNAWTPKRFRLEFVPDGLSLYLDFPLFWLGSVGSWFRTFSWYPLRCCDSVSHALRHWHYRLPCSLNLLRTLATLPASLRDAHSDSIAFNLRNTLQMQMIDCAGMVRERGQR